MSNSLTEWIWKGKEGKGEGLTPNTQAAEATCDEVELIPVELVSDEIPEQKPDDEATIHEISDRYAFEGNVVRLNHKDYEAWKLLYPNIDLNYELQKLDIEFSHEKPKKWFITASQKLSYQNKHARPMQQAVNAPAQHWNSREAWENEFL